MTPGKGHHRDGIAGAKLSDQFFLDLVALAARHKTDAEVFLTPWCYESGLDPTIVNRIGARGLNQMIPKTLRGLGAPANYETLSGEEQLRWIEKLIDGGEKANGGPFKTAARYFHSNLFPKTMERGDAPDVVVYARDAATDEERQAYAYNSGLDLNHDGRVTLADLERLMASVRANPEFAPAFARLARAKEAVVVPTATPTPVEQASSAFVATRSRGAGGLFIGALMAGVVGLVVARVRR